MKHLNDHPAAPLKVLVVEAEKADRSIITALLLERGCEVTFAENGLEGIFETAAQDFDFVVMDWKVPRWGGGQTLSEGDQILGVLRISGKSIPVLLYSDLDLNLLRFPVCRNFHVRSFLSKKAAISHQRRWLGEFVEELLEGAA